MCFHGLVKLLFGVKMTDKFLQLMEFTLKHEGGYSNNPLDPGGETNFGISKRSFPEEDIENLTVDRAKEIYFRDYWLPLNCDAYDDKLALAIFDSGVNCGIGTVKLWIDEITKETNISLEKILFKRLRRYANIVQKNPKMITWLDDWLIRVLHIYEKDIK